MVNRVIRKSFYITLILVGALLLFGNAFAEDDTTFSITVNPSLNLSVSKSVTGFTLTPSKNGSYDSDGFNVTSSTNNATGYTLTMSVDDTDLVSETINVNTGDPLTIPTLTKTQDGITAAQFEASTDSSVLNHYGISIAGANYNAMESPKTILETSENNTTSDVTAISLAAKLDLLTVPAVYSTTINFQMVANALPEPTPPGTHGGEIDDPSSHPNYSIGGETNVVFPANSLLRAFELAYVAAGKPMYIQDSNADIGWRPMTANDTGGEVRFAMQDITMTFTENNVTHGVCEWAANSAPDNSYLDNPIVMDLRDGRSYRITKAADGRCWLADNLALNPTDAGVKQRMSTANTNATAEAINNFLYGSQTAIVSGWSTSPVSTAEDNTYSAPRIDVSRINTVIPDVLDTNGDWKSGVYYNYCAASIGTYCYGWQSNVDRNPDSPFDVEYDVCPAGWRMPASGTDWGDDEIIHYDYDSLIEAYPTTSAARLALRLPLTGWKGWYGDHLDFGGEGNGDFWSISNASYVEMYELYIDDLQMRSEYGCGNNDYLPVRCIAK